MVVDMVVIYGCDKDEYVKVLVIYSERIFGENGRFSIATVNWLDC